MFSIVANFVMTSNQKRRNNTSVEDDFTNPVIS